MSCKTRDDAGGCRIKLRHCLAIIVRKEGCQGDPGDFWMYESGYLLFQSLLSANSVCWWNNALNGATKSLIYRGYVSPGALLVGAEPCALEVLRGAWARRVLQPPAGYQIVGLEDLEECKVTPIAQTQWTPLPEAVCAVVLRLSSQGRPAGQETIRQSLMIAFPHVLPPSERVLYDTLVQLTAEKKLYQTSNGFFIVTPEKRRSRSQSRSRRRNEEAEVESKGILMSTEEALVLVHGEMTTVRDGDVTHQCIQTNLADVICGGNSSDKIMYARNNKRRSASFPSPHSPDRRASLRFWGSARRLRRSASTRTLARHCTDSSSSTECNNESTSSPKKSSLLSRIFRRSKRSQCQIHTFSAQFPPAEWFNSKAVHLHSVSTQTSATDKDSALSIPYYFDNSEASSSRSATLPRRHRRLPSNDSSYVTSYVDSREHSPTIRYGSSSHSSSTLPRNRRSPLSKSNDTSRKTSRSSLTQKPSLGDVTKSQDEGRQDRTPVPCKDAEKQDGSVESLKPSHRSNGETDDSVKDVQNSGPSSIESHKSSKTGSSFTSGPSSLESNRTVIKKEGLDCNAVGDSSKGVRKSTKRKDTKSKPSSSSVSHSNSFTLQVTTSQNSSNADTPCGNNRANTKIFVQNSPIRSVITVENGQHNSSNPNFVIINGADTSNIINQASYSATNKEVEMPTKNSNVKTKDENVSLNNSRDVLVNSEKPEHMNNRKLSLQLLPKDYKNLIKNMPSSSHNQFTSNSNPDSPITNGFREFTKNSFGSSPSSPAKSFEGMSASTGNVYSRNLSESKVVLDSDKVAEKSILGSEPNISCKASPNDKPFSRENSDHQFPSLSDLGFNFSSLTAQKILKGVSINSIDTLVELNMAASSDKQNNYDVVHTDFGLV